MTPSELIEESENEYGARVKPRKQKIKAYIMGFREHLEKSGSSQSTTANRLRAVRSFYKSFDIIIPEMPRNERAVSVLECNKGIPDIEEIREILKKADPLERAIVMVGCSSGLSVNEITALKIKDFEKGYDPSDGITTLELRREKTNFDFVTFLTPEASAAVQEYLNFRNRPAATGDKHRDNQLVKQQVTIDEGFLFIVRRVNDAYLKTSSWEGSP